MPLLCAVWIVVLRWHTYDEPQERDITWYAVLGHEYLAGRHFFTDLWFHKPPAVKLTYAGAEMLFGYGPASIFWLNVVCALATLGGVIVASRRMGGGWGPILWAALCGDLTLQANQPNTEVFINACVVWAFVLLLRQSTAGLRPRDLLLAGALTALATLFKHIAVLPIVGVAAVIALWKPQANVSRGKTFVQMAVVGFVIVLAWAGMLLYFRQDPEQFRAAWAALFTYNDFYVSSAGNTLFRALQPLSLAVLGVGLLPPVCAWLARRRLDDAHLRCWGMYTGAYLGAYVAVVLPGRYFAHYFQLLLPWVALGIGGLPPVFHALFQRPHRVGDGSPAVSPAETANSRERLANLVLGLLVATVVLYEVSLLQFSAVEWSTLKYGPEFVATYAEGRRLDRLLLPGETFYDFGQSTGLYYVSRRTPPTGLMLYDPLLEGPLQRDLSQRVLQDLRRTQPEVLVVPRHSVHYLLRSEEYLAHDLFEYLKTSYVPFPDSAQSEYFALFARRGGRLARQWSR